MSKEALLSPEAERLYVIEQCSLAEIASRLAVAERTLRNWKEKGGWDDKRRAYLGSRKSFHEDLYEFARDLMATIRDDWKAEREVSPSRLYSLIKIIPLITKAKDLDAVMKKINKSVDAPSEDGKSDVVGMIEDLLGIKRD